MCSLSLHFPFLLTCQSFFILCDFIQTTTCFFLHRKIYCCAMIVEIEWEKLELVLNEWNFLNLRFNNFSIQFELVRFAESKKEREWSNEEKKTRSMNPLRIEWECEHTHTHAHHHLQMECHLFLSLNLCAISKSGGLIFYRTFYTTFYFCYDQLCMICLQQIVPMCTDRV